MPLPAVKFVDGSNDLIEGIGAPFGGPFKGKDARGVDLYGETFDASTDFAFDWYPERPLLYQHGLDVDAGIAVVGRVKAWEIKADTGLWVQAQLDAQGDYYDAIKDLIAQHKLYFSSGAMAHLVDVDRRSGQIKRWPWTELSLTPTPANLLATLDFATAEKHYKMAGLALPLRSDLDAKERNSLEDSDFAYIDKDGNRHLPIEDEQHTREAMARFDQTDFESEPVKKSAAKKIIARARHFGIEIDPDSAVAKAAGESGKSATLKTLKAVSFEQIGSEVARLASSACADDPLDYADWVYPYGTYDGYVVLCRDDWDEGRAYYYRVDYTLDASGHVATVGMPQSVEIEFVPTTGIAGEARSVRIQVLAAIASVRRFSQRTKGVLDRRLKEGRELSKTNHDALDNTVSLLREQHGTMGESLDQLRNLLTPADPEPVLDTPSIAAPGASRSAKAAPTSGAKALSTKQRARALAILASIEE